MDEVAVTESVESLGFTTSMMTSAAVEAKKDGLSAAKRGGFGSRVKTFLRGNKKDAQKKHDVDLKEPQTPKTDPDAGPEEQCDCFDVDKSPSRKSQCQEDESAEGRPQEQSFVSECTDSSFPHTLRSVAVVPVAASPKKNLPRTIEEASTRTNSTSSSSAPAVEDENTANSRSLQSYNHEQTPSFPSRDDETVSMMTFDTGKSKDGLLTYIGNMIDQQWRVVEDTMRFSNAPIPEDQVVQTTGRVHVEGAENMEYVRADKEVEPVPEQEEEEPDPDEEQELMATRGRSMDSKVASGITTPSAGTRVISNSPRKKSSSPSPNDDDDDKSMDDSLPSVEEDLIHIAPPDLPRVVAEMNDRFRRASVETRPISVNDATDSTNDIRRNNAITGMLINKDADDRTESPTVISGTTLSVGGVISMPAEDVFAKHFEGFDSVFGCVGDCNVVKYCLESTDIEKQSRYMSSLSPVTVDTSEDDKEEKSLDNSTLPTIPTLSEDTASKGPTADEEMNRDGGKSAPEGYEASLEASIEHTVISHDTMLSELRKARSMTTATSSRSANGAPGKGGLLRRFRSEVPDLKKAVVKESELQSSHPDGDKQGNVQSNKTSKKGLPFFRNRSKKLDKGKTEEGDVESVVSKHRPLLGRFSIKRKQKEVAETPKRNNTNKNQQNGSVVSYETDVQTPDSPPRISKKSSGAFLVEVEDVLPMGRAQSSPGMRRPQTPAPYNRARSASANSVEERSPGNTSAEEVAELESIVAEVKKRLRDPDTPPRMGDQRPLNVDDMKRSSSKSTKNSQTNRSRKVHFSRTPLILQRLQTSKLADAPEEDASFLLEIKQNLKTSSWCEDAVLEEYATPRVNTNVLMTSHSIPKNPTPPSPVQVYGAGDREFETM